MKKNPISIYIDLLFCLVIIPLTIMLLPVDRWITHNTAFLITLVAYVYALYYIYRRVCIPKLFMQHKYLHIAIIFIILIIITEMLTHFPLSAEQILDKNPNLIRIHMNKRRETIWFFFLIVTGFSLAIELTFELFRQIISKQEIEAEKNKAELSLYKAQINPHFLFNTLNTLYALVISNSDKTESAFIKFAGILRYMYSQNTTEFINVEKELEYIKQYVDLQKLRLNHHTKVNLKVEYDNPDTLIPPMIFITFIENAFKYGVSSENDSTISIYINAGEKKLVFETENHIMNSNNSNTKGIGISNCRKRLDLLYPEQYKLINGESQGKYKVHLEINMKQQE